MATWNIGIDEKGRFGCFSESEEGPSFVCAVATKKNEKECEEFLYKCAENVSSEKAEKITFNKDLSLPKVIDEFFHARKISDTQMIDGSMIAVRDNDRREEFFEKIFRSPENTDFVGSRQNYYLNSLYEVLGYIFESDLFKSGDLVNIYIAERALEVTGYEAPAHIVVDQLYAEYCKSRKELQKIKKNVDTEESQEKCAAVEKKLKKINEAIKIVFTYGYKDTSKKKEKALRERWCEKPNGTFLHKNKLYNERLKNYHDKLNESIKNFLERSYPNVNVGNIECQSANKCVFPAMADIAATLVSGFDLDCEVAKKRSLVKGLNIEAFIEDGDTDAAAELIGSLFFDAPDKTKSNLEELFTSVKSRNYDSVWKILTDHCIEKMHNRGIEGELFLQTGDLIELLDEFIDTYKPSPIVYARYLKMKGEYAQHSGSVDLDAARALVKKIKDLRENCRDKEVYAELYNIEEEFWIESYAQVMFNSYDFNDVDYKLVLEKYESNIKLLPFYSEIYAKEDFKDKRYSVIWGTLGQALAFSGNHDKAIEYLRKDYDHSNYMRFLPASFLVVEYLRKGELENAVEWFKNQVKEVLGGEKTIEQFFLDVEECKKVDNWLVLNFLRIWAYSMKIGKPVVQRTLSFEKWTECNFDEYSGGLVLKWAAICNHYANGSKETTVALLKKSIEVMTNDSTFTINSLAISPMRVLNVLDAMPIEKYAKIFDDLCKCCESFAKYAKANPVLDPKTECKNVWDAAMILPFNYA